MSLPSKRLQNCPVCGSTSLISIDHFVISVSSDSRTGCGAVDNAVCRDCGVVFNASGARFSASEFYSEHYQLLSDSTLAEFVYKVEQTSSARGINDRMIDTVAELIDLKPTGRLLEVGCGKGLFLRKFKDRFPGWEVCAVEPSKNAQAFLNKLVPEANVEFCAFEDSSFAHEKFDLVVSIGVLEHVPSPVDFCRSLRKCLGPGGACFVSVPNFEENPSDLLTYDHLTRFTPVSLRRVLAQAELKVGAVHATKIVPMWAISVAGQGGAIDSSVDRNGEVTARRASRWLHEVFATYDELADRAARPRSVALYGTGIVGLAAPDLSRLKADLIDCFVDDNVHLHGAERLGRPVVALETLPSRNVSHVSFSANPCYLRQMDQRARSVLGERCRIWSLPDLNN